MEREENVERTSSNGSHEKQCAGPRTLLGIEEAEELTGIPRRTVDKWREHLRDPEAYKDLLRGPSWRKAMGLRGSSDEKGASGTGEDEWFTPLEWIELAREVLPEIDLDPATHEKAQKSIQATAYYTKKDDGLTHEWYGRVWLNPPYSRDLIKQFVHKLCEEYQAGRVIEAILLTHNYTDTAWFHEIFANCSAICFPRGRVKFHEPSGKVAAPTQGQAFAYFGANRKRFAEVFTPAGAVVVPEEDVA
jgi:phage N-6-adenine-methyltransferase